MGTVQRIVGKKGVSWRAFVTLGRDLDGKRVRETETFARKRDAEEWIARMETRAQRNPAVATYGRLTLQQYVTEHWLPFYRTQAAPSSYIKREGVFRLHVLPHLGRLRLQDITPRHVQDVYTHLEKTLAPQTVSNIAASLDAAFNKALQWEMVTRNPCDGARPPRVIKRDPQIWTPDMLRHLLAQEPDPIYRALWVTVAVTGARIGEVLALTWGDLDRETSTISITKSLTKGANGVWTVGPTKTRKTRVVAVSSLLWDLFDEAIASTDFSVWYSTSDIEGVGSIGSPHAKPSTLVFVNKHGRPISESMAYHAWQNAISRADVPSIHIHDLRHLHATSGLRLGIPLKVMSDRLGHADIGITANTYTHVQRDLQHDAADRIAAYLLGHEEAPSNE